LSVDKLNTGDIKDLITFKQGDTLFKEGDDGGDLYVILKGEVEIHREKSEHKIVLANMKKGEVIGLFTCLDKTPRKASAKAKTDVNCRKIPHLKIQKAIGNLPKWFAVILKEYSIRLMEVEEAYMSQSLKMEDQKLTQMTPITDARFYCSALISLSKYVKVTVEGDEYVPIKEAHEAIAETLGVDIHKVQALGQTLLDSGLLLEIKDPDKGRPCFPMFTVEKLADFPNFIARTRVGPIKKMVDAELPNKSIRLARALVKYASAKELDTAAELTLPYGQLKNELNTKVGVEFDSDALIPLETINLVKIIEKDTEAVAFTPQKTGRFMAQIIAFNKLRNLSYPAKEEKEVSGENAA